jgi:hypothetical protein
MIDLTWKLCYMENVVKNVIWFSLDMYVVGQKSD